MEEGIYKRKRDGEYFTSICFEYNDEENNITQYPIEDILEKHLCYISDFYHDLNNLDSSIRYLEFSSSRIDDMKKLRTIIGKSAYNKECGNTVKLVIE